MKILLIIVFLLLGLILKYFFHIDEIFFVFFVIDSIYVIVESFLNRNK